MSVPWVCLPTVLAGLRAPHPSRFYAAAHILASGRYSRMNRWVRCLVIHHRRSQYKTEEEEKHGGGRGCVLCLLGISLWVLNLVFLKDSEAWAAQEMGEETYY